MIACIGRVIHRRDHVEKFSGVCVGFHKELPAPWVFTTPTPSTACECCEAPSYRWRVLRSSRRPWRPRSNLLAEREPRSSCACSSRPWPPSPSRPIRSQQLSSSPPLLETVLRLLREIVPPLHLPWASARRAPPLPRSVLKVCSLLQMAAHLIQPQPPAAAASHSPTR